MIPTRVLGLTLQVEGSRSVRLALIVRSDEITAVATDYALAIKVPVVSLIKAVSSTGTSCSHQSRVSTQLGCPPRPSDGSDLQTS